MNGIRYVDKTIKLIEKVPELLKIIGFFKSFLIILGYKITFKSNNAKKISPIVPNKYFK